MKITKSLKTPLKNLLKQVNIPFSFKISNKITSTLLTYSYKTIYNKAKAHKNFSVFIKTQSTPNPHFLKFLPGQKIMDEGETYDFQNKRQALISELATRLFDIEGINKVFYGGDYISVGKEELVEWDNLKPQVIDTIVEHFTNGKDLFNERPIDDNEINENDSETVQLIKEIITTRVRPIVQEDGGDIKFVEFDEETGVVYLQMKGSCSGCPSSGVTLKNGIERMLTHYVGEVTAVEEFFDEDEE